MTDAKDNAAADAKNSDAAGKPTNGPIAETKKSEAAPKRERPKLNPVVEETGPDFMADAIERANEAGNQFSGSYVKIPVDEFCAVVEVLDASKAEGAAAETIEIYKRSAADNKRRNEPVSMPARDYHRLVSLAVSHE